MKRCREATTHDSRAKHYIDILMSSVEYDTFVKLMRLMRPVAQAKAQLAVQQHGDDPKGGHLHSPAKGSAKDADGVDEPALHSSPHRAESKHDNDDNDLDRHFDKASSK
jgi:hypothetical protein